MPRQEFRVLSPTAMAALILPGGVSTSSATECHSRTHFFRRLHFRHQPKLSLIVSVPLPHFAWTARPSTLISNSDGRNGIPFSSAIFAVSSRIKSSCSISLRCVPAGSASVSMYMM